MPRKFTTEQVREIRRLKRQGIKTKVIAEQFGMSVNQINRYARKKIHGHRHGHFRLEINSLGL